MGIRSFLALEVPSEVRRALGDQLVRLRAQLPPARWVRPEGVHLTLKFLGEVESETLENLGAEILGFVTREDLAFLGRGDSVAVYIPQSYNFAGNVMVFPRARVRPIEAEASAVMQFIVSGGVSGVQ